MPVSIGILQRSVIGARYGVLDWQHIMTTCGDTILLGMLSHSVDLVDMRYDKAAILERIRLFAPSWSSMSAPSLASLSSAVARLPFPGLELELSVVLQKLSI